MLFKRLSGTIITHRLFFAIALIAAFLISPEIFAAKKSAPVTTPTSPETEQRLANIERLLENKGLLDMLQQINLLQQEIATLRGEIEVNNHLLNQMKNRQRDLYADVDRRLQVMEDRTIENHSAKLTAPIDSNPPLETLGHSEAVIPPESQADAVALTLEQAESQTGVQTPIVDQEAEIETPAATVNETDPVQTRAEYQQAFKLLKQSQYDQAIKAFRKFLQAHPNDQYSDNAQYWMAEALYVKRQFEDAIREYNNLVSNYPDSQKVPHGLLKIGYSYQELGKADTAKLWYTDVRQRFPGTTASRLADDRLKNINDS